MRFISALLMYGLFLAGCRADQDKVIATVGNISITRSQLNYQLEVEKAYGFDSIQPHMALVQLLNNAFEELAADSLKVNLSRQEIKEFSGYVNEHTRDSALLSKVKAIFRRDTAMYAGLY